MALLGGRPWLVLCAATCAIAGLRGTWATPLDQRMKKFLIASFPDLKQVRYLELPDTYWRLLVGTEVTNFVSPKAMVADNENMRVYVADPPAEKVYWYKLIIKDDGRIETDGKQHIAADNMTVVSMALDTIGNVYFSGKKSSPAPSTATNECIYRLNAVDIATGNRAEPEEVWTRENTGVPNPAIWMPTGVAVDAFSVFWGNGEKGQTAGSVVKGSGLSRLTSSELAVARVADNSDEVRDLVLTPTSVFYATPEGIFAVAKAKSAPKCTDVTCPAINRDASDVRGLAFDGDGTVYAADNTKDAIYSFPSGSRAPHKITKVTDAQKPWGVAVLAYDTEYHPGTSGTLAKATGLMVIVAALIGCVQALL